jgi:hypothetical protein
MTAFNFNLRGIPSEVMALLKKEAKRLQTSVNVLILKIIERELGLSSKKNLYHDLDSLAGTWSSTEEKSFKEDTKSFEQIDKEIW